MPMAFQLVPASLPFLSSHFSLWESKETEGKKGQKHYYYDST
jgi:hypothetical protein